MTQYNGPDVDNGCVYIIVTLASQSQASNTSTINWSVGWDFLGSPTDRGLSAGQATIDGAVRYNVPGTVASYPTGHSGIGNFQTGSGSYTVSHDSAGNHTTTLSGTMTGADNHVSTMSTQSFVLPRIPKVPSAAGTPAPSLAASSGPSSTTVNVSWSAPSDDGGSGVTGYNLQVATDSGFTANVSTYTISGTSTSLTGLAYATTYYVRTQAKNTIGTGAYGAGASITTGADVPAAPTIGAVSAIGPLGGTVAWSAPSTNNGSAVTGYALQVAADSAFATVLQTASPASSPYAITGLTPSTTYYVRVAATNSIGTSAYSGSVSFTTLPSVRVPNAGNTAWVDALVYMPDSNGTTWVGMQIKTPSSDGTAWV